MQQPTAYLLAPNGAELSAVRRLMLPSWLARGFESPLELIAACTRRQPVLLVAMVTQDNSTCLPALAAIADLANAPRRLLIVEPAVLDEVTVDLDLSGRDLVLLHPVAEAEFVSAVASMSASRGAGYQVGEQALV